MPALHADTDANAEDRIALAKAVLSLALQPPATRRLRSVHASVPVKNLANAKQRLSPVLGPEARQELARAMCADVLETLGRWRQRPAVAVVTSDRFAGDLAAHFGFEIIADDVNPGETGAIEMATAFYRSRGALHTLVIPADIPLIEVSELEEIVESAPPSGACWCRMRPGGDECGLASAS
jgi:2-phospho-L-lactate guanylyltransferase